MRILLLSDVHANLVALEAVLKSAKKLAYDKIFCAGDLVGYYPWPNEVVEWAKGSVDVCVMGNHDAVVAGLVDPATFSGPARAAISWTDRVLTDRNRRYLSSLPLKVEFEAFGKNALVHDTPLRPLSMEYVLSPFEAAEIFEKTDYGRVFYGHTHVPVVFEGSERGVVGLKPEGLFFLKSENRYLINPGSVGQPRDGVPKASFALWDLEEDALYFERVEFDVEKVIRELKAKGLPLELGYRLYEGY
ncbi:MAG: metallophosphoesterase family protein [Aquificae bacterium]|nr:metallophosphoesterase family protein [Aquificota bacterium]